MKGDRPLPPRGLREGGVFEKLPVRLERDLHDVSHVPILGIDEDPDVVTPGFAVLSEKEVRVVEVDLALEATVSLAGQEKRETITCDHPGCKAYRTYINGKHVPRPAIWSREGAQPEVSADCASDEWHERDGKDYCPRHGMMVPDPFSVCSEECGVSTPSIAESDGGQAPEPEDLPVPIALIAAASDQRGDGWDHVFYFVLGLGLGALVAGLAFEVFQ